MVARGGPPPSSLTVSATDVSETDEGAANNGPVSGQSTATPSGAVGTITYSWAHLSTSSGSTPSISSSTAQSPTFSATVNESINSVSTWRVTATDDLGSAQDTITVTLNWNDNATFTVSATNVDELLEGFHPQDFVEGQTTTTPSGEVGIVSYSWQHLSTSSGLTPDISSTTARNPTFSCLVGNTIDSVSTWRVTAQDTEGSIDTDDITVALRYNDISNITDIAVESINLGLNAVHSGTRFNNDGSIDEVGPSPTTFTKIHPGEWWGDEPEADIGTLYEIRCVSLINGTWSLQPAAVGTWVDIDTAPVWRVTVLAMTSPSSKSCDANFAIRRKSDNEVLGTFTVSARAEN